MIEKRLLRVGLFSSVAVNVVAISLVGFAQSQRPKQVLVARGLEKLPLTRLIEIQMPSKATVNTSVKSNAGTGGSDSQLGVVGSSGPLSDSLAGAKGSLDRGSLAKASKPLDPPKQVTSLKHSQVLKKGSLALKNRAKRSWPPNRKVGIRDTRTLNLGIVKLKRPGPQITGGYHGIVDLRKLKLTGHLLAMLDKMHAKLIPNKSVGKQHVKVIGKSGSSAICVPTGGHTIYGNDLTIYLGKDIRLDGTKFCVPGGIPGIPGNGSGQSSSQGPTSDGQSGQPFVGQTPDSAPFVTGTPYEGGDLPGGRPIHESGGASSTEAPQKQAGESATSGGLETGNGAMVKGIQEVTAQEGERIKDGETDATQAAQLSLQERYLKYARGPLRGVPEWQGSGRELHLPESHGEVNPSLPGADVPKDQRSLVDSPKEHRGAAGGLEASSSPLPRAKPFQLVPSSVGSSSDRGDVLWADEMKKTAKGKASRRVKGDGKQDGGEEGTGLLGDYYSGVNFDREVFRRPDRNIDFDWTFTQIDRKRMPTSTYFSVRWKGEVRPKYSERYTIYTASDDGERVWINGQLLISNWTEHGATEDVGVIDLVAGRKYSIKVEYFANSITPSIMKLYWESPSQPKEYIPQSCLFYPTPG